MGTFCSKSKKKGNPHSPRSKVSEGSRAPALIVIHTLLRRTHSGMDSRNPVTWSWISACEHCLNQPLTQRQVTVSFGFAQGKPDTGCIRNILIPYPSGSKAVLRLSCRCVLHPPVHSLPGRALQDWRHSISAWVCTTVRETVGTINVGLQALQSTNEFIFWVLSLIFPFQAWFPEFKLDFGNLSLNFENSSLILELKA